MFILVALGCAASHLSAQVRGQAAKAIIANAVTQQGTFGPQWFRGGGIVVTEPQGDGVVLMRVDPVTGVRTPFLADSVSQSLLAQYNQLSGQHATVLPAQTVSFEHAGRSMLFRVADSSLYVFDLPSRTLRKLRQPKAEAPPNADALMRNMAGSQLVNGTYAPDYSKIGYIRGYDLYVMNTATGQETRLTTGGTDEVMNGRPDWVYPEELNQTEAFFWSPDGQKIAYLQFDERPVVPYPIVHDLQPQAWVEMERYPKAGAKNPVVKLFIIDLETHETVEIHTESSSDVYVMRPSWTPDGTELLFQRMNRHQDTLELLAANPRTGTTRTLIVEHDPAYVNIDGGLPGFGTAPPVIQFLKDQKRFLWASERGGWRHWYLYDVTGRQLADLTPGEMVFDKIHVVDEANECMYVTAFLNEGQEKHLFRARLDGRGVTQLTQTPGVHEVSVDPAAEFYADVFQSTTQAPVGSLHDITGKLIRQTGSVTYHFDGLELHSPEYVTVKAADGVTNLHGLLYKPVGYDATKRYPLIVHVYGGPQVQQVKGTNASVTKFQIEAQDGYMVWVVDNRGTPNRGRDFERATYRKLGQVDLDDQAAAVRALIKTHPYIDSTRVGITGSSYGGYLSALALLRYPDVFQVGVAASAVTDWRNYDTIYTERYMRTPVENPDGYDKGSTLVLAQNLTGRLLIMHGTTDNNVHLGNAMQLVEALRKAGKSFEVMFYPEERHGVDGAGKEREFLARHLKPVPMDQ